MTEDITNYSKHFRREEFACHCGCGYGTREMDLLLIALLESLREKMGRPLTITSGGRCEYHNHAVGGVPNSAHTRGTAVDVAVYGGEDRWKLVKVALSTGIPGVGIAHGFVHLDVDEILPRPALWLY